MNAELLKQLRQYIGQDGRADIRAIRADLAKQGVDTKVSFAGIFGGMDDSDSKDQPIEEPALHPLWQAAIDWNAMSDDQRAEVIADTAAILAKADTDITDDEWNVLVNAGLAGHGYDSGDDNVQGIGVYFYRLETPLRPTPPHLFGEDKE